MTIQDKLATANFQLMKADIHIQTMTTEADQLRTRIATLEAENARLTAANESMQEDAVQNTYAFGLMLKSNKEQAEEIARLTEKVRYAYVQIEALEKK